MRFLLAENMWYKIITMHEKSGSQVCFNLMSASRDGLLRLSILFGIIQIKLELQQKEDIKCTVIDVCRADAQKC